MEPPTTCPTLGRSFMIERPMVVFPQPDSPTTPTHSPASTLNDTSSTARTLELLRRNSVCSPSTSRTGLTGPTGAGATRRAVASSSAPRAVTLTGNLPPPESNGSEELPLTAPPHLPAPRELTHESPAAAVDRRGPVAAERGLVHGRGVALVALEGVGREVVGLLAHEPVPHHLGQDRGGGHRRALGVTGADGTHGTLEAVVGVAQEVDRPVDQDGLGALGQAGQGAPGRHPERLGHAPLVALGRRGVPDGPVLAPRADRAEDLLAPGLTEHLGIPQPRRHGPEL